jgi:hypothetical protein
MRYQAALRPEVLGITWPGAFSQVLLRRDRTSRQPLLPVVLEVAVRAKHVALRDFTKDALFRPTVRNDLCELQVLFARFDVMELQARSCGLSARFASEADAKLVEPFPQLDASPRFPGDLAFCVRRVPLSLRSIEALGISLRPRHARCRSWSLMWQLAQSTSHFSISARMRALHQRRRIASETLISFAFAST